MNQVLRVLIVEDSEDDADRLLFMLRRGGYKVVSRVVNSASGMCAAFKEQPWDIITSAHALPDFDAPAALALAKEACPDVPFIIVSGKIELNLAVSLMRDGAKDYVQKGELARIVPVVERELHEVELRRLQRRMNQALVESEQKFKFLYESAGVGITYYSPEGGILSCNPAAASMMKRKPDDLTGVSIFDLFPPEAAQVYMQRIRKAVGVREIEEYEDQVDFSGEQKWFVSTINRIEDALGQVTGVQIISTDITKRKRAEERLASQSSLLELVHDAIIAMDAEMNITYWNRAAENLYGWSREEALGQYAPRLLRSTMTEPEREEVLYASKKQGSFNGEVTHHTKDGRSLVIEAQMSIQTDPSGQVTGYLTANRDITARAQAEAALIESMERERARANELEALMDAVPAFIWISRDPECREMMGNRYGNDFLRMDPKGNISKTAQTPALDLQHYQIIKDGIVISPSDLPMQVAAATGKPARDFSFDLVFDDGTQHQLIGNVNPLLDSEGKSAGAVGAFIDITELRKLENEQREQATRMEIQRRLLDYRDQQRQMFARDLHDGPVQDIYALVLFIEHMKGALTDQEARNLVVEIISRLNSTGENLREMIREMRPPLMVRFGLAKALKALVEEFKEKHPEITVETSLMDDGICLPEASRLNLYRICQEALNNTFKHARASRIAVQFECTEALASLEIQDNGNGFLPTNHLVSYSYQGHYGLVGMNERAESIGGRMELQSGPGKGTRVRVVVPIQA